MGASGSLSLHCLMSRIEKGIGPIREEFNREKAKKGAGVSKDA